MQARLETQHESESKRVDELTAKLAGASSPCRQLSYNPAQSFPMASKQVDPPGDADDSLR